MNCSSLESSWICVVILSEDCRLRDSASNRSRKPALSNRPQGERRTGTLCSRPVDSPPQPVPELKHRGSESRQHGRGLRAGVAIHLEAGDAG